MKNNVFFSAIAAISLLSACNIEEADVSPKEEVKVVHFTANPVESKATFGALDGTSYLVLWGAGDAPAVSLNYSNSYVPSTDYKYSNSTATFTASITDDDSGSYTFVAVSPASAVKSMNSSLYRLNMEIPSGQKPGASSPDEKAIVLYAVSNEYTSFPESVDFTFNHFPAYLKLTFSGISLKGDETVQSLNIVSDKKIAGRAHFTPSSSTLEENEMTNCISINVSELTEKLSNVFVGLAPVDLSSTSLGFEIVTNKTVYSKAFTMPTSRSLTSGKIQPITISMSDALSGEPEEYKLVTSSSSLSEGDEIIIVSSAYNYALATLQNASNRGTAGITKDSGSIWSPCDAVQRFTLVSSGDGFKLMSDDGYYLYCDSGDSNTLKRTNSSESASVWSISIDENNYAEIVANSSNSSNSRHIQFNSNLFSTYLTTKTYGQINIYRKAATTFPVTWSFPAPSALWVSGEDYEIKTPTGTYVYSDNHEGMLSVNRTSSSGASTNNYEDASVKWSMDGYCINHNGMYEDDYWLFELYNVDNAAGNYTIKFKHRASAAGAKYYLLEYSTDGTTWSTFGSTTTSSYQINGTGDTYEVTYSYLIADANSVTEVEKSQDIEEFKGTLRIRTRVCANVVVGLNQEIKGGGSNRLGGDAEISFTAAN